MLRDPGKGSVNLDHNLMFVEILLFENCDVVVLEALLPLRIWNREQLLEIREI